MCSSFLPPQMARYFISLHPENQYTFQTNDFYRARWSFLPDKERVKFIATQLTYLEFHEWLDKNLRHHSRPESERRLPLEFDVKEGFVRTDVLLYGSICEAALYAVAKDVFDSKTTPKHADLLAAFETSEQKTHHLGNQTLTVQGHSPCISGKIGICYPKVTRKSDTKITFESLIKAAKSINAIKPDVAAKLDKLREARNTIHLGVQIAQRQATGARFYGPDRETAKQVTEEMRKQLFLFCKTQSLTA